MRNEMRVTVLGGYGNAGTEIVRLASNFTDHSLTITGRSAERARSRAFELTRESDKEIGWRRCDASSEHDLKAVAAACDLLLVASSTIDRTASIADACLTSGTHYMDIGLSATQKWAALRNVESRIKDAGLLFITDGGFHPGIPGVLIRYAAKTIPGLHTAWVAGSFALDWKARAFSAATEEEFIDELRDTDISVWLEGRWQKGYRNARSIDFGEPVGRERCIPMMMEEIREVVDEIPSLRNAGFFVAGFGPVVDYMVMPICMAGAAMGASVRRRAARLFMWGLERFASDRERAVLQLDAAGTSSDEPGRMVLRVRHDDPYILTAAPVVCCLRQIQHKVIEAGLFTQGKWLDPGQTMRDLRALGIEVDDGEPDVGGRGDSGRVSPNP